VRNRCMNKVRFGLFLRFAESMFRMTPRSRLAASLQMAAHSLRRPIRKQCETCC
jgi:hypothetical protein